MTAKKNKEDMTEEEHIANWKIQRDIEEMDKEMGITQTDPNHPNLPNLPNYPNNPNPEDQTLLIKYFLQKPKRQYANIGRGLHNDVCYIATYIEDDEGRNRTAVVTSDRNIYVDLRKKVDNEWKGSNHIKNTFGLYYREEFLHEIVETDWSNEVISKWLYENYQVDIKKLFRRLVSLNKKFMVYEDKRVHSCIAIDILRSYFFFLFNANSRTHFYAEPGSGKTNQMNIFRALMFKPIASPDFSSASVYRTIEGTGGTILIDDFDDIPEEEKQRLNRHIKVNYKRFKAVRSDGGRNFKPQGYDAYSHLILNNTTGIEDDITRERVVTYKLLKHKDAPNKEVDYRDHIFKPIRDDCYICLLQYWKEVQDTYRSLKVPKLKIRDLENWKPQLTIAKVIGEDVYKDVLSYAVEYVDQERLKDLTDDWEYLLLEHIVKRLDMVDNDTIEKEFSPNDISQEIADNLYLDLPAKDKDKKILQLRRFIGGKLSGYTIFRKTRPQNCVYYHISREKLRKILENKHFLDLFQENHPWVRVVRVVRVVKAKQSIVPDPSLNEKIQNCIEIIKENPDDNYNIISDKYGQDFIDKALEKKVFYEALLGKKLEFIGGK